MRNITLVCTLLLISLITNQLTAREWHDETKKYSFDADLIAASDEQVVLKASDGRLLAVAIAQLSDEDREYLASKEGKEQGETGDLQTWTTKGGFKIEGRIVAYGRKELAVQQRRGRLYVNDRLFDNLPELYRFMIPKVVAHFTEQQFKNETEFRKWVIMLRGAPRSFVVDGVLMELENGDEYAVPFIFFSDEDLKVLQPGWERWLASAEDMARQQQEELYVRAQAEAYQRDQQMQQQVAAMQLLLSAADAGVVDLWEVALTPHYPSPPIVVVVPGRNSQQAVRAALMKNPNCSAGPVRKLK